MNFLRSLIGNHVLANISFVLVLALGIAAYQGMPRAHNPDINFNWIYVLTALPGASSIEVEKRITDPIEDKISSAVKDLYFVSSTSRDGVSLILVRFDELSEKEFDKRVADLRREVQNVHADQLPDEATDPEIQVLTTSSGFPTAMLALTAADPDDEYRRYATMLKKELERLPGVDSADMAGIEDPELHIAFYPDRLVGSGISPLDIANTVSAYFRDVSVGDIETSQGRWLIRLEGTSSSIDALSRFPIVSSNGHIELGQLAEIYRSTAEPTIMTSFRNNPATLISIIKLEGANTLDIVSNLIDFIEEQNESIAKKGYRITLIDDQTLTTKQALGVMQQNAGIGLILVVLVTYLFLGGRIAFLTSIGIPFTLTATFIIISSLDMTLNNMVLLGVVIALGMIVDDAVVIVESIYYQLQRGSNAMHASLHALKEVASPVFTSVLTTVSVFFPLTLLTGILGEFMKVVPIVVCTALLCSLLEAFWILPAHVTGMGIKFRQKTRTQKLRERITSKIRRQYSRLLIGVFRSPLKAIAGIALTTLIALALLMGGAIKFSFFASDPYRLVYVNAELPAHYNLSDTLATTEQLETLALQALEPEELRDSIVYSGQQFTETELLHGNNLGQVFISLNPRKGKMRGTREVIAAVEKQVGTHIGEARVSLSVAEDGPPVGSPLNVKVRGNDFDQIESAIDDIRAWLVSSGNFKNIKTDFKSGSPELKLRLNGDAIKRAGLTPEVVTVALQAYTDGSLINQYQHLGEEIKVRLKTATQSDSVESILQQTLPDSNNNPIALGELVVAEYGLGLQNIRHYNFLRAITLSADIANDKLDTVSANQLVMEHWESISKQHPAISLDFSGELDDIAESQSGITQVFVIGLGLIYLILGTQFKSYVQPLIVLISIPLACIGVVYGLVITRDPMSLYTLYGITALSGIAVNSAIVLIAAANSRLNAGMGLIHATIYASRRRIIPILITSLTTIAGLFSLAAGFGGKSLIWGPIATAIVSGLSFSTALVLIVMPMLYYATESLKLKLSSR